MSLPYGTVRAIECKAVSFMSICQLCSFLTMRRDQRDAEVALTAHLRSQHHVRPKIDVDPKPGPLFYRAENKTPEKIDDDGAA